MAEKNEPSDDLFAVLAREADQLDARRAAHVMVRQNADYQQQLVRVDRIVRAFVETLQLCLVAVTRDSVFSQVSFFLRNTDDLATSVVMAAAAFREGGLNAGRRELRYLLEMAVQALYVDEAMGRASFEDRILFFEKKTQHNSVAHVRQLRLEMLGDRREEFVAELTRRWAGASRYVHPTIHQLQEKLSLRQRGITPGFETAPELKQCVDELFEVAALAISLLFHAVGPSFSGDLLVDGLDRSDDWPFHANRFVAAIDAHFDYKHERQAALPEIVARRAGRLGPAA